MNREMTREVPLGRIKVGGKNPIWVEAMGRRYPAEMRECLQEIAAAQEAGCEIFRIAVPDRESLEGLKEIKKHVHVPLIADVHFDLRLGIEAIFLGVDAVRVNPGTVGNRTNFEELLEAVKLKNVTLRLGANTGSIPFRFKGKDRVKALFESIEESVGVIEEKGIYNIILSAKSTDVEETISIYEKLASTFPYPLHVGLTEAGSGLEGIMKSTIALGILLREGIGNNIRVSLTASQPVLETKVAWILLESLGLRCRNIQIISCPTCARRRGNVVSLVHGLKRITQTLRLETPLKVAVMGCEVNGPGEAREADWGLALSKNHKAVLFAKGEIVEVVPQEIALAKLLQRIRENIR
ncbi:MAG: flavodoxin-dependent (E)-4-hydroxy-3-methylbut-2-enyl-diphosphate synthase [Atribacterota bacterium]|nr:flavodoxin-dependent (E)-4-hydroxy-3-methylbut-2-enyl-diphosphate synthase [Atribacterota bacterium]